MREDGLALETNAHYGATLRARWPHPLAQEWQASFPDLFDADDLRLAHAQPNKHFHEWLAAIHLSHREGALSLVEKYGYKRHERKSRRLAGILGPEGAAFVQALRPQHGVQPPDLFVYIPGTPRFWFAEVKGPGDTLRPRQRASHILLMERFGVDIELITLCKVAPTAGT